MRNIRLILSLLSLLAGSRLHAQDKQIILDYISTYREIAISEMQRSGVPAAIKLAQGIHETLAGTSDLVMKSNNHFGIKCKSTWTGESVSHDDDLRGECFRKYGTPADSYKDHSDFLKANQRYSFLFKLDPLDYSSWAWGLKKAGYATNPKYPQIIIRLIEDYNLQDYSLIALGKTPLHPELLAKTNGGEQPATGGMGAALPGETTEGTAAAEPVAATTDYPTGEFRINDTRVIYATRGTSFLSIAEQYNVSLSRLFDFNDMQESEMVMKDQLVYLQRKRKTGSNEFHVVKAGETLYDIAQAEGMRLSELLEYNQLEKDMIPAPDVQLYLRYRAPARPLLVKEQAATDNAIVFASNNQTTATPAISRDKFILHTVRPKETVYSISKKYNVKIDDIVEWNRLSSYALKTGQQLKIYK